MLCLDKLEGDDGDWHMQDQEVQHAERCTQALLLLQECKELYTKDNTFLHNKLSELQQHTLDTMEQGAPALHAINWTTTAIEDELRSSEGKDPAEMRILGQLLHMKRLIEVVENAHSGEVAEGIKMYEDYLGEEVGRFQAIQKMDDDKLIKTVNSLLEKDGELLSALVSSHPPVDATYVSS